MQAIRIADVLAGKLQPGTEVEVRGWIRTRRDSKAGISFLNVSDGSCQ
jgi:asparaginyl-tRNA synthetase